jgi:hypothetical protein
MKMLHSTRRGVLSLSLLATVLLASCGGGDPYTGLWLGSLGPQRSTTTVVLEDGKYFMIYSKPGNPSAIAGLIEGTADFEAAKFSSTNAREYNWESLFVPVRAATLSARVGKRATVEGSVNGSTPFSVGHAHDLDQDDARLAAIVGSHTGQVAFTGGLRDATFVVTADGRVSTNLNGCLITGNVVPRMDTNAYDLTVAFGGAPCHPLFVNLQFKGVAFYREDSRQLHAAVIHSSRTQGIAFGGTKQ